MRTAACILGAAALFGLAAAPATAQVVARHAAVALSARDDSDADQLLLTLRGPDPGGSKPAFESSEMDSTPLWSSEAILVAEDTNETDETHTVHLGGAVAAEVARVEITAAPGRVVSVDTVPGEAYAGRDRGYVRFFLTSLTLPRDENGDNGQLRMFDAAGTLLAVLRAPEIERRARLLGGRVVARVTSSVDPVPGMPERRSDRFCLVTSADRPYVCRAPNDEPSLDIAGRIGCPGRAPVFVAIAPAATRSVHLVLGSGRRLRLAARPAPLGRPERVVAATLPRGEAIRSATARGDGRKPLASVDDLRQPPAVPCDSPENLYERTGDLPDAPKGIPPGTQLAASVGAQRLLIRDQGDLVCAGLDALALDGSDCRPAPVTSRLDAFEVAPDGTAVAGVAARVATIDVALSDGSRLRLPTQPGAEYTGRFRDAVRFVFTRMPAGLTVDSARLLDAAGHVIGQAFAHDFRIPDAEPAVKPSTAVRARRLRVRVGGELDLPCVDLVARAQRFSSDDCLNVSAALQPTLRATVSCTPRRTILWGMAPRRVRRAEVVLGSGRVERVRLAAMPRRFKSSRRVFLVTLPARASVTRVRFPGAAKEHDTIAAPLPPAVSQCGYDLGSL